MSHLRIIVCVCFFLSSCQSGKLTYYRFKGVTITRLDDDSESDFYYGYYNRATVAKANSFVKAEYSGVDNCMDLFLIFHKNKSVELIHYGGEYLTQSGEGNPNFYFGDYENHALDSVLKIYLSSDLGCVRVSDVKDVENRFRKEYHFKVDRIYGD